MRRRLLLKVGTCFIAFFLFFLFVPVVWGWFSCAYPGFGYLSLSYDLFKVGGVYFNGQFLWVTGSFAGCI